jgi:hypothetical protein
MFVALVNGKPTGIILPGPTEWDALDYMFAEFSQCVLIAKAMGGGIVARVGFSEDEDPVVVMITRLNQN